MDDHGEDIFNDMMDMFDDGPDTPQWLVIFMLIMALVFIGYSFYSIFN